MTELEKVALYIVATPIGNLADISQRALTILHNVAIIAVEDTRYSRRLLQHYAVTTPTISLHEYNEIQRSKALLVHLQRGQSVALISDAGTPLISDPGYRLVSLVCQHNITVIPIPGCSALIAALSASGLPSDRFFFAGFLPVRQGARQQTLHGLAVKSCTLIFYESPRRLAMTLKDMVTVFGGNRLACIARELTKLHETIMTDSLTTLLAWVLDNKSQQRGECVVLVEGSKQQQDVNEAEVCNMLSVLLTELPVKKAVAITSTLLKVSKNRAYATAIKLQQRCSD